VVCAGAIKGIKNKKMNSFFIAFYLLPITCNSLLLNKVTPAKSQSQFYFDKSPRLIYEGEKLIEKTVTCLFTLPALAFHWL
jgi:hypothetical protein